MQLSEYLRLPWTIVRTEHDDDGEYIAIHIAELPGFVVAGATEAEIEGMFWPALEAFIRSYLDAGETPPRPAGRYRALTPDFTLSYSPGDVSRSFGVGADTVVCA
jgi:predicted RNase H-like HicB family nuclease